MKAIITGLFLVCNLYSFAQTITISGTVKDKQGQPVPLAFIRDARHSYATYADSSGAFVIKADPESSLIVLAVKYVDNQVKINGKNSVDVILDRGNVVAAVSSTAGADQGNNAASFGNLVRQDLGTQSGSTQVSKAGFTQEPTRGSIYLFPNWVHGYAIGNNDSLLYDIDQLYNYDKTTGSLLFTKDMNSISQVNKQQIKYFYLYNGKVYSDIFEAIPAISNKPFIEVLLSTPKYKIVKQTETKLVRADFHTDGIIESGKRYDEYQDNVRYYFIKLPTEKPRQISLRKKTLKEVLSGDADKFINAQGDRDIDDDYLQELSFSLNP